MKKEWSQLEAEELILAYKLMPQLWDIKCQAFKDKEKKSDSWQELADKLNTTTRDVHRKIHNLRNQFISESRKCELKIGKRSRKPYVSKWMHFKNLMFLRDKVVFRPARRFSELALEKVTVEHVHGNAQQLHFAAEQHHHEAEQQHDIPESHHEAPEQHHEAAEQHHEIAEHAAEQHQHAAEQHHHAVEQHHHVSEHHHEVAAVQHHQHEQETAEQEHHYAGHYLDTSEQHMVLVKLVNDAYHGTVSEKRPAVNEGQRKQQKTTVSEINEPDSADNVRSGFNRGGDQYDIFGAYVASELRNASTNSLRKKMKRKIQQAILDVNVEDE